MTFRKTRSFSRERNKFLTFEFSFENVVMKTAFSIAFAIAAAVVMTGCLDCADCSDCADASRDTALCYRDYKEYYRDRREWRDDVKAYEDVYQCNCK